MRTVRIMRAIVGAFMAVVAALVGVTAVSGPAAAAPVAAQQRLYLEPYAHCGWNTPYVVQAKELGWRIYQEGPKGTPGKNDWKCSYRVSITVPIGNTKGNGRGGVGADDAILSVPGLYRVTVPIDWRQMCFDQYGPTASLRWAGGTNGDIGSPWQCIGAPGRTYAPYDINTVPDRLKGIYDYVTG